MVIHSYNDRKMLTLLQTQHINYSPTVIKSIFITHRNKRIISFVGNLISSDSSAVLSGNHSIKNSEMHGHNLDYAITSTQFSCEIIYSYFPTWTIFFLLFPTVSLPKICPSVPDSVPDFFSFFKQQPHSPMIDQIN